MSELFSLLRRHLERLAGHHPLLVLLVAEADVVLSPLLAHVEHLDGVSENILLHFVVERRVCREGRRLVYFDQPGPEVLVDHDVEAEDLEAHRVVDAFGLADPVHVVHVRLANDYRLHYDVLDLFPNLVGVATLLVDDLHDGEERALVACLLLVLVVVVVAVVAVIAIVVVVSSLLLVALLEVPVELVDRVVRQVDVHVVEVGVSRLLVGLRGESREALLVDEDAERIEAVEEDIEAKIVLEAFDQVRSREVVLDDPATTILSSVVNYLLNTTRQENTFTLGQVVWLDDECLPSEDCSTILVYEVVPELARLQREYPSSGKELVLVGEGLLCFDKVAREVVLAADALDAWVLIHLLIRLHFGEEVGRDAAVVPGDVPILGQPLIRLAVEDSALVVLFVLFESESASLLRCLLHDIVVRAVDIHYWAADLLLLQGILFGFQSIQLEDLQHVRFLCLLLLRFLLCLARLCFLVVDFVIFFVI